MVKLLDYWAPWCGPCQTMKPVIAELTKELQGRAEVIEINVDEDQDQAAKYGVMGIPTFIVLNNDKEVGRKVGVTPKAELLKLISSCFN